VAEGSDVYVPVSDINDIFDGRRGKPGLPWGNRILNLRADGWAAWKINAVLVLGKSKRYQAAFYCLAVFLAVIDDADVRPRRNLQNFVQICII